MSCSTGHLLPADVGRVILLKGRPQEQVLLYASLHKSARCIMKLANWPSPQSTKNGRCLQIFSSWPWPQPVTLCEAESSSLGLKVRCSWCHAPDMLSMAITEHIKLHRWLDHLQQVYAVWWTWADQLLCTYCVHANEALTIQPDLVGPLVTQSVL